jgi:membrane dipeptidase
MIESASDKAPTMPGQCWDLHCDLPMYLAMEEGRGADDPACPCNLSALAKGAIGTQVCAIFSVPEPGARGFVLKQIAALEQAQKSAQTRGIQLRWSLEYAGGIFQGDWEQDWELFDAAEEKLGPCAYISPTWNGPSRFGGGAGCEEGLTAAGRTLLAGMAARGVPIDFSHMSDALAHDILDWHEQHAPRLALLASHSNLREVCCHARNLPTWCWRSLVERGGCIGLCWYPLFVGNHPQDLLRHAEVLLQVAPEACVCGADLFLESDPYPPGAPMSRVQFFPELSRSSAMVTWRRWLQEAFGALAAQRVTEDNAARWAAHAADARRSLCSR